MSFDGKWKRNREREKEKERRKRDEKMTTKENLSLVTDFEIT